MVFFQLLFDFDERMNMNEVYVQFIGGETLSLNNGRVFTLYKISL